MGGVQNGRNIDYVILEWPPTWWHFHVQQPMLFKDNLSGCERANDVQVPLLSNLPMLLETRGQSTTNRISRGE